MPGYPHDDNVYEHEQKFTAILNFPGNVGGERLNVRKSKVLDG